MAILSKSMSLTARQSPETTTQMRSDLLDLITQMGVGSDDILTDVDTSTFVTAAATDEGEDQVPTD